MSTAQTQRAASIKPEPCYFCGTLLSESPVLGSYHWLICDGCGATSTHCTTIAEAVTAYNRVSRTLRAAKYVIDALEEDTGAASLDGIDAEIYQVLTEAVK